MPDPADRLLALVRAFARESQLPIALETIGLDTRLETDLGLDSLSRAELNARLEQGFGVELPDRALLATTVAELLTLVRERGGVGEGPRLRLVPDPTAHAGVPEEAATLLEVLDWHVARQGERVHIHYYDSDDQVQTIRYRTLAEGAARVANRLHGAGVRPGETVALMLPSGPGYFFSFFGVLRAGAIPVPIYPPARPQLLEDHLRRHARILANAGCVAMLTEGAAARVVALLRLQLPALSAVLTLDGLDIESSAPVAPPARADDIAFLQYTSGSTGAPKGVMLSHAELLANIRAMGAAVAITPEDRFVSWLPLYHDMGLIGAWLGSLYFAIPLISFSPLTFLARPRRWLQAIDHHRATLSAAPNFAYELCLSRIGERQLAGLDLSSWRRAFNGAEPVSAETLERFAARFARCGLRAEALAPVYGLAEAAVGLCFPPPTRGPRIDCIDRDRLAEDGYALRVDCADPGAQRVVGCGQPLPGYRLRVVDARRAPLPERHEGLVQFQGPSATRGYYRNPEASAELIHEGWHETGDRGYLADGEIHLTGRVKDLIIRGGRNLYPYELEQAIGALRGVRQGCVVAFAARDPGQGSERLVVVAETKERDPGRRALLRQRILARAGEVLGAPPDEIVLAPPRAVLKTSSGKLRRGDTRARYLAGRIHTTPAPPWWQLARVTLAGLRGRMLADLGALPQRLYAAHVWLMLALIAPPCWLAVALLPGRGLRWAVVRRAARLLRRLVGVRLVVEGRERLPSTGAPWILVANHQSYVDALVLIEAIGRPLCFVAKRELGHSRLAAYFLRRLDCVLVDRFDVRAGGMALAELRARLAAGCPLALFPEATFRVRPGLLPFRMGAFALAADSGTQLVPVALDGTRELLAGARLFSPRRGQVCVYIGPPFVPPGRGWDAAVALREQARDWIETRVGPN
ncbi:AMP-binding protein [Marichromatium bheemlicum]|uniref:AMP-binding protein n=1 Tax=Marichromatium bheemlicum TaxID=365339 RepID=A0ABX1IBM0_9GAMM|nr:AMP-binding protein [Marichromatium bheemlicum]NKN33775.1 AMP-binding protein [Marichromatium bheemlicum]